MTMKKKHVDAFKREIHVGDYIAYAALWSRSATLKFGIVTRLADKDNAYTPDKLIPDKVPTIRARTVDRNWGNDWEIQSKGKEITLGYLDRLIVIDRDSVPEEIKALLEA